MKKENLNKRGRNSLLVDFLEWNSSSFGDVEIPKELYTPTKISEIQSGKYEWMMDVQDIDFEGDYRFIMAVVDKIEKLDGLDIFTISNEIIQIEFAIESVHFDDTMTFKGEMEKIKALNDMCLDFVIWYNKNVKFKNNGNQ